MWVLAQPVRDECTLRREMLDVDECHYTVGVRDLVQRSPMTRTLRERKLASVVPDPESKPSLWFLKARSMASVQLSKRIGSRYISDRTRACLKTKNPAFQR